MTKCKATYIGSTPYEKNYYIQHWSYRGHEYMVTVPTSWACSSDYLSGGYMSQKNQHKREQESIDAKIEAEKNPEPIKKGTWTKEYEDEVWKLLGFD